MGCVRKRPAARVLVLDAEDRVLLLRYAGSDGDYWYVPGGAVEDGESFEAAAIRELEEEIGVHAVALVGPVGERVCELDLTSGERVIAEEQYFAARHDGRDVSLDGWADAERLFVAGHRWWSVADLAATKETVFPEHLVDMLAGVWSRPV